jgi:hypothetical protein
MPQDNQRSDTQRSAIAGRTTHGERSRSQKRSAENGQESSFGAMAAGELWLACACRRRCSRSFPALAATGSRATSEVELASKLPNKLTAARSVPDALSAYQEWLSEWMNRCGEDSYRFVSDGQRIVNAGVRCFGNAGRWGRADRRLGAAVSDKASRGRSDQKTPATRQAAGFHCAM